jgi:prevent-host-death family protein
MADIGVRELKIHASEIVRKVKEKGMRYVITLRGHPVAAIIPVDQVSPNVDQENAAWDELIRLGQQISQSWQSPQTSTEILSEMQR